VFGFWIGAMIGSFLNVVIYRMPRGRSLSEPKYSFCPSCKHRLEIPDLVPLLSWLVLRGRCRHCGAKVSSRYFVVEFITAAIFSGIWWQYLVTGDDVGKAIAYAAAAGTLVAVIFIDWELYIIPDQINAFLLAVGIAYNIYLFVVHSPLAMTWGIPSSLAGAIVGVGLLWGITLLGRLAFGKDAMGHGDIKMARGIGAVLFPAVAVMSFALAILLGAVLGIVQVLARQRAEAKHSGADVTDEAEDSDYAPESIGSILKCGIGYFLWLDAIGLFFPKFYIRYFGEDPFEPVITPESEGEDVDVERTMIPFGPYLALGAIVATLFEAQLRGGLESYWKWAVGRPALLEHLIR
jgi:leader peptidase (prepilin peptidase)/N-methyltransferase